MSALCTPMTPTPQTTRGYLPSPAPAMLDGCWTEKRNVHATTFLGKIQPFFSQYKVFVVFTCQITLGSLMIQSNVIVLLVSALAQSY